MNQRRIAAPRSSGAVALSILLAIATILTLWPACTGQFTQWDDLNVIAQEPTFLPPTWHSLVVWWTKPILYLWIPVSYSAWGLISLAALRPSAGGVSLSPYPFHCANVLLHVLAVVVVYQALVLLVKRRWPALSHAELPAAAGAAIFALHPVQVESVAWAMGLRDVLCGLLTFTALWQYLLAISAPPIARRRKWHYLAATLAYGLALLAKPTAITIPLIAAALEIATEPRMYMRGFGPFRRDRIPRMLLRLGIWIAMAVPIALIARMAQPVYRVSEYVPIGRRPIVALDAIAFYVGKIFWPMRLCIDYGRSPGKIFDSGQAVWTWLIPAAIAAMLAILARRRPLVLAGAAIFVIALLPVLGFAGFDFQSFSTVADHYLYVSMFGVGLMAASILGTPWIARHGQIAGVIVLIVLGGMAFQSFRQTWTWHDTDTLFTHSLQIDPLGPAVNDTRATAALEAGQAQRAAEFARASIRGNPKRSHGYVLLSAALSLDGPNPQALDAMMEAYQIEPNDPVVVMDTAKQLGDNGRDVEANHMFLKAIQMDPTSAAAFYDYGVHLLNTGHADQAFPQLQQAAALAPTNPAVLSQLGDVLAKLGRLAEARAEYESALRLRPGFDPAIRGLLALPAHTGH
jgi:protein O-mannosyl-transferase